VAQAPALEEYEKFQRRRLSEVTSAPDPDFDRTIKRLEGAAKAKDQARKKVRKN